MRSVSGPTCIAPLHSLCAPSQALRSLPGPFSLGKTSKLDRAGAGPRELRTCAQDQEPVTPGRERKCDLIGAMMLYQESEADCEREVLESDYHQTLHQSVPDECLYGPS